MTGQEKKSYLQRYRDCERSITRIEEELQRWQSRAEWVTTSYSLTPSQGNGEDRMQMAICEIAELRGALYDRLTDAAAIRHQIERVIGKVDNEQLRLLLEYRYVDAMTFEQIAQEMCYSWRQINNLHNKALDAVSIA